MASALGPLEIQLLGYAQSSKQQSVTAGELQKALGWTPEQERHVLSRLAKKRYIARVRPGLYLVPPRIPPGGVWSPSEALALNTLINDRGGRYQLSGPNAFHRYGWTEQVPNRLYAYNNRISGDRQIGTVMMTLIKVGDDRLGGTETVRSPEAIDVVYASKARALLDAVYDWSRFDSLPKALDWIGREMEKDEGLPAELIDATIAFGNQGTMRRIGATLEQRGAPDSLLSRLERKIHSSTSYIPLVPNRAKRGSASKERMEKTSKRWGIVFNDG